MDEFQKMLQGMTKEQQAQFLKIMAGAGGLGAGGLGADPYGMGAMGGYGGYNPFRTGAYAGMSAFGGMPPQASGFRYRNKMNEYRNDLAGVDKKVADYGQMIGPPDPAKLAEFGAEKATTQEAMDKLSAERKSYIGNAVAGAAPGVISGVIGIVDKQRALNKLRGLNPNDYIPEEMKATTAQAKLSAASSKTADDAFRRSQLQQSANNATQAAILGATSPEQVQNAALRAQKVQNQGIQQLGAEGLAGQNQRKQYANQLAMQQGQMRQNIQDSIQKQIDATKQAKMKDIYGTLGSIGTGFVTGGV